jgi:hypothetical protein
LLAYGIRFAMYIGMAVMMALIWINLGYRAVTLNDRMFVFFYSVSGWEVFDGGKLTLPVL